MDTNLFRTTLFLLMLLGTTWKAVAQEYISPTKPAQTGKSPGVKSKLIDSSAQSQTYVLIFSKGDEVVSGLTEFAQNHNVKAARYSGIGDALSAKVGWYDYNRKMFKVIPFNQPVEITSLLGDVAIYDGKPVAHSHINVSSEDGNSHGGHLLELIVGPTLEVFLTVYSDPLNKKLNPEFQATVIDPELEK